MRRRARRDRRQRVRDCRRGIRSGYLRSSSAAATRPTSAAPAWGSRSAEPSSTRTAGTSPPCSGREAVRGSCSRCPPLEAPIEEPRVRKERRYETFPKTHTGGCLCGGVRYCCARRLRHVIACHCSQCRRTSGHHAAMTSVPTQDLVLISLDTLVWYRSSPRAERGICRVCGGNLFWRPDAREQNRHHGRYARSAHGARAGRAHIRRRQIRLLRASATACPEVTRWRLELGAAARSARNLHDKSVRTRNFLASSLCRGIMAKSLFVARWRRVSRTPQMALNSVQRVASPARVALDTLVAGFKTSLEFPWSTSQ